MPTSSRPFGAQAMPLTPSSFFGAFQIIVFLAKSLPVQPFQAQTPHRGPAFVSAPPLMYSVPLCQTRPATNAGEWASGMAAWFLSTNTPPFGGLFPLDCWPPSPSNTWPAPNANEVGVWTPAATSSTGFPFEDFGGGG